MLQNELKDIKNQLENSVYQGNSLVLKAQQNRKDPEKVVFVLPDGRLGFPSRNSIDDIEVGSLYDCQIEVLKENYAFINVLGIKKV